VEYQKMRDASIAIIREIGVEAGGCNVQFAVNPENGDMLVVEMNPRVSRSSALASKATGFPIARVGAKLAVGYHLHELPNDITRTTPASFEPVLDYVVVKIPRFAFEKFSEVDDTLGVQMKSVGETMAIGRTFRSAWQKGFRGLETGRYGWVTGQRLKDDGLKAETPEALLAAMRRPTHNRPFQIKRAMEAGLSDEEIYDATMIDPWFLDQFRQILEHERAYAEADEVTPDLLRRMKREGFGDRQLAVLRGEAEADVRQRRWDLGLHPSFNVVDTCAAEFPAATPYFYSSYEDETESVPSDRDKVVILGSGPNRIGQGIEFDYCCVQAVLALRKAGFEAIMINSNPETVSTDFDVSDKLYFEPLTLEDVLEVLHLEKPKGVIVQLGGQTPLNLAKALEEAGVPILGTSVDAIDRAEDRDRFAEVCRKIGARVPENGIATSEEQALAVAARIGFPVLVRPSYVLGGRGMRIVYDDEQLQRYFEEAARASEDHPVLVDRFLEDAFEADVDALCDGRDVVVAGIMQHIEDAGVHSGDSACVLPPYLLSGAVLDEIRDLTKKFALELGVVGLMNVQYAIKAGVVYVLEVNPRASRTVPFVSKATGVPLARLAARIMAGERLADLDVPANPPVAGVAVKEAAFPFNRFDVDVLLGPEMRSTGEVMGFDDSFGMAFAKAQVAAGNVLPQEPGDLFVTVNDADKATVTPILRRFHDLGFRIMATKGTQEYLTRLGVPAQLVYKVDEGRPNIVDHIVSGTARLLINTPMGKESQFDDYAMRRAAIIYRTPYLTTMSATSAACDALIAMKSRTHSVRSLQERIASVAPAPAGTS
ncbi:MAG TPA: carbamoyl-phosphate synthase large subunit, partial [Longimicrobiales bacterium]|nr:carbamoyl-phosphate synthase large subunit [Longimicrobiales bacterium]